MLKQRVITALVLLVVFLPVLFYSQPEPFCALTLLILAAGGWEWCRLNGVKDIQCWVGGAMLGLVLALVWAFQGLEQPAWIWWVSGCVWLVLGPWLLWRGVVGWHSVPQSVRLVGGLVLLAFAWLALAQARVQGVNFVLSLLALVWVADIGAYFGGRAFGRRKLAPSISPGKSWAGVYTGVFCVLVLNYLWSSWDTTRVIVDQGSLFYALAQTQGWAAWPAVILLVGMSVVGDLVESLVKRSAGFKDSSQLLPGHGGVLDRLDALIPTLPLAMLLITI